MEEKKYVGEQPKNVELFPNLEENTLDSSEGSEGFPEEIGNELTHSTEAERGVPVGKFKSVEDLMTAYNNLQAEFTRKCQRLSALEKEKVAFVTPSADESQEGRLKTFLSKNQEAVLYAEDIKSRVMQDENLKNDELGFDKAWAGMLFEKLSSPNKSKEPLIQNFILKDDELKNLVIENYMKQLQEQKSPIIMSSSASGEKVTKTVTPKPDSFEEAKKVVLDLLS